MEKIFIYSFLFLFLLTGCSVGQNSSTGSSRISKNAQTLLNKGIDEVESGDIKEATDSFNQLVNKYPDFAVGYYNLGLVYAQSNELYKAINSWEQAVILDNSYADAYYNLGLAYKSMHNNKKAIENFSNYIALRPNDAGIDLVKKELIELQEPYQGKGIIGRVSLSDNADFKNKIVLSPKNFFKPDTACIYAAIEIANAPKNTDLKVIWYYLTSDNQKVPVNLLKFVLEDSKNVLLSLNKPEEDWPIGKYELDIIVNGKINDIIPFEVLK
ncbi:MAG: hypothetical protein A2104_10035 [Candidatus Melainabacteria bacterium GWF2_32_7]|nr:MAG: hypothetical protein A2104_10035 [Candidatus Melainabacteria bacterium GWF2_32_7]